MIWFLLGLGAFAQDADGVIDCDSSWYEPNFTTLNADDDCTAYTDTGPCAQPLAGASPDMVFQFSSPQNVWVQLELGWGSRLAMNYYTTVDQVCGDAITCASGYWGGGGFNGVTWFAADANRDYFIIFDNQGEAAGPPSYFAEISGLTCCFDDDGDGFFDPDDGCDRMPVADQDCDDADPNNYPGNTEVCDGVDNDCDGSIDENASATYYYDADSDGYGDDAMSVVDCGAPSGYVDVGGDCDDTNVQVNPGASEICNGIDDDCDDNFATRYPGNSETCDGVDNDCDTTVDEGTECFDDDGDGFTENGGDCNDSLSVFSPTAEDVCNGNDEDCDGRIDEGTECVDDDGDGYCEGPNCADGTLPGDCNDGLASVNPGETETDNNGIDDDCSGEVDTQVSDADGDGVAPSGGDCAPDDASTFPGAAEQADGVDNDCDGTIDEGTASGDDDGDGECEGANLDNTGGLDCGDGSTVGDCNDADADTNSSGTETANQQDDDCDGVVDEGTGASDADFDGFTEKAGDCDDTEREIYPGAEEVEDGVDNDCDGEIDEGFVDVDGDGFTAEEGDCDDNNGWVQPGGPEYCDDGIDNNCNDEIDENCEDTLPPPPATRCGCASTGTGAGWLILPLLGLALRRRNVA